MKFLLILALAASHGADAYRTNQVINHQHGFERNIMARPFVHGQTWIAVSSGAGFALTLATDHQLRKHHHDKTANFITGASIVGHTYGAVTSR